MVDQRDADNTRRAIEIMTVWVEGRGDNPDLALVDYLIDQMVDFKDLDSVRDLIGGFIGLTTLLMAYTGEEIGISMQAQLDKADSLLELVPDSDQGGADPVK